MRRFPPPDEPPRGRPRRDMPRPEGPFDRLLRQRPERDPAPIIIGGTIAFLALVIVIIFVASSVLGGDDDDSPSAGSGDGSNCNTVAEGIEGCLETIPPLPAGLVALSGYLELQTERDIPVIIGLPLKDATQDTTGMGFYTFAENRWQRLVDASLEQDGAIAQGDFQSVPENLAVLRVVAQAYQVGASLPKSGSLHADAGSVQLLSPRDFTPASDGSVQGSSTDVSAAEGTLVLSTIVGSSQDTAAVVNDILADEAKRAQHVQNIAALVQNNGLDGIDLEYSSVDVELDAEFTSFVTALAESLHTSGKKLSLTLPPPTNQRTAYDWAALGGQVDYIKVLPIADPVVYWDTMPGALGQITELVDSRKVLLVISPFSIEGQGDVSTPIGYLQAMVLASEAAVRDPNNPEEIKPGTQVRLVAKNLDEGEGASPIRWNEDALTVSFALGGTARQRIYIENSYSVAFKLELVQAYGLGGVTVSDGSGQSDVANVWPTINGFVESATATLRRPNDQMLLPIWQAPDGGTLGAGAGTTATWIPDAGGQFNLVLVVSDGDRRFGQQTIVEVKQGAPTPTSTTLETFAPDSDTPTAEPTATEGPSETATPEPGNVLVEVGMRAEGDDEDVQYSNEELVSPGSSVIYLVTIDNDSNTPVTLTSLLDSVYGEVECLTPGSADVVGAVLGADDGDGTGELDGGVDEIQCTFTATAPEESGEPVSNTVTAIVEDDLGGVDADQDAAKITTS